MQFKTVWTGLEELGPIWEPAEFLMERDPEKLKGYIQARDTKARNNILNKCPVLYELFYVDVEN